MRTTDDARGYEASIVGELEHDREIDRWTRFDLGIVGLHWGEGRWSGGAREVRTPLGIILRLVEEGWPTDIPPQAARDLREYLDP